MPSIPLHPPPKSPSAAPDVPNPLPQLLQTPSGLAILELQGTIHSLLLPHANRQARLPLYSSDDPPENTAWMKRVYMYVGKHQRLTGEVKKLPKPLAVIHRKPGSSEEDGQEELEIAEIIRHKIIFSGRPEPVSGA
ncbi:putative sister chromatid cohesion protein Ctf8 [Macrophomina phaseolina]|uniref:Sister chromatid cohesion protein Ctf8 n=1 Tax=Macrophomina phaseolina TaxID=35725 RepID=A0ABQ8FSS2_9PEZI|nr:putative sister chromatid cohesion protein Ctf8 [Macrophomina phaseolina]